MEIALFFGRFHPLMVHLPIGFLLLAILMWGVSRWQRTDRYDAAISLGLLTGAVSAVLACIMGYLLSLEGGYDQGALTQHTWAGILTAIFACSAYLLFTNRHRFALPNRALSGVFLLIGIGLTVAGHMGGSLTHGETYLVEYAPFGTSKDSKKTQLPTQLSEVEVYTHVVAPIFEAKCTSCHREGKKKGGLSLISQASIQQGGDNGPAWLAGNAAESELFRRIHLPPAHEDAMPPEGKTPLNEDEKQFLTWWIDQGADFALAFDQTEGHEAYVNWVATQVGLSAGASMDQLPIVQLPEVPPEVLSDLRGKGFVIRELVAGSNLFDVTFPVQKLRNEYEAEQVLTDLTPLSTHIAWLNLSGLALTNTHLEALEGMKELAKLRLDQNRITHEGLAHLTMLPKLAVLNIYGNPINNEAIDILSKIPSLERVYVWKTQIEPTDEQDFELVF